MLVSVAVSTFAPWLMSVALADQLPFASTVPVPMGVVPSRMVTCDPRPRRRRSGDRLTAELTVPPALVISPSGGVPNARDIVGYRIVVGLIYENLGDVRRLNVFCVVSIHRIAGDDGVVC